MLCIEFLNWKKANMINILKLTPEDLRHGVLHEFIPEFYAQEAAVENGSWHTKDSVLNHVCNVFMHVVELLRFEAVGNSTKETLQSWFDTVVGSTSRGELL